MTKNSGATLIEVLMYIAILVFLMGSLMAITCQTVYSTDQINKKIVLQQEANFILQKLDWALTGASGINVPALNISGNELSLDKFNFPQNPLDFSMQNDYINLSRGIGIKQPLNSQNIVASNFLVSASQIPGQPEKVQISFTLTLAEDPAIGQNYQLTKYLRQ